MGVSLFFPGTSLKFLCITIIEKTLRCAVTGGGDRNTC